MPRVDYAVIRFAGIILAIVALAFIVEVSVWSAASAETASWYQSGARTANGERFRPDGLTCAHRTLPFGAMVKVTDTASKRSVVCRVNDRGPAKWTGRAIDLSRGAARALGILRKGVVRVTIARVRG